jgi:rootletin
VQATESDAEKQAMRERIDNLLRSQQGLESKTTSLQLTVDRLTLALAKTEEEENSFRERVSELSVSLNDSNTTTQGLQDRIQQLQRALTNSEHDRKIMQERMQALKAAQQDGKNRNHMMAERIQQLQNEEAGSEVILYRSYSLFLKFYSNVYFVLTHVWIPFGDHKFRPASCGATRCQSIH